MTVESTDLSKDIKLIFNENYSTQANTHPCFEHELEHNQRPISLFEREMCSFHLRAAAIKNSLTNSKFHMKRNRNQCVNYTHAES